MAIVRSLFGKSVWSDLVVESVVASAASPAEACAPSGSALCVARSLASRADILNCFDPCKDCPLRGLCGDDCGMLCFDLDSPFPVGDWGDFSY